MIIFYLTQFGTDDPRMDLSSVEGYQKVKSTHGSCSFLFNSTGFTHKHK